MIAGTEIAGNMSVTALCEELLSGAGKGGPLQLEESN